MRERCSLRELYDLDLDRHRVMFFCPELDRVQIRPARSVLHDADEVVRGAKFASMFLRAEAEEIVAMNVGRIHDIEMGIHASVVLLLSPYNRTFQRESP